MRETQEVMNPNSNIPSSTNPLKLIDCSIRMFVIPLSIATIWLTVTNQQDNIMYGKISFTDILGLKYMVYVTFISALYALFAALSSWISCLADKAWVFFLSDQIVAYILVSSGASVVEIMFLAYKGDKAVSWSEACSSYGQFCIRIKLAFIFHALALICFIALTLISAFRVFSVFEPPSLPTNKEVDD